MSGLDYGVGDWIAFYRDGRIVIDEIAYPKRHDISGHCYYMTRGNGEVRDEGVLEARRR